MKCSFIFKKMTPLEVPDFSEKRKKRTEVQSNKIWACVSGQ